MTAFHPGTDPRHRFAQQPHPARPDAAARSGAAARSAAVGGCGIGRQRLCASLYPGASDDSAEPGGLAGIRSSIDDYENMQPRRAS